MDIKDAISKLDPDNHHHWTAAGLPAVSAVSEIAGQPVTREQIASAAPGYDRDKADAAIANPPSPDRDEGERENDAGEQENAGPDLTKLDASLLWPLDAEQRDGEAEASDDADALEMIEEVLRACNSDRFRHNYELQAFVRQWHVQQEAIRAVQARIDIRQAAKAERRA